MDDPTADRRLTMRVLAHWRLLSEGGQFPRKSQIDPRVFGPDWRHCFLLDMDPVIARSRFSYVGAMLQDPTWPTFERQSVGECLDGTLLSVACSQIALMMEKRMPVSFSGAASHHDSAILYRAILLPLSDAGEGVAGALGAINHREVSAVVSSVGFGDRAG